MSGKSILTLRRHRLTRRTKRFCQRREHALVVPNERAADRQISTTFKAFFIDEAWVFLKNPSIQRYVVEALKTWRKANAAMILSTQSLDELRRSDVLDVIIESCPTKLNAPRCGGNVLPQS